jgi:hypothetical protein
MFRAFESLRLVLEHDKSEVFHFSRTRSFEGPAINLGYAPFTGDTPLRPKAIWRYLGFFFDRKLQFKEHAHFYTTRAFTTVRSMGMLGNSVRGLTPPQKHLLYRTCVVPVMTYGFCLWFFKGARVKGLVKAMSQVQCTAARWITGNFRTAPGGSGECLGGLLPMHLLLQQQADRGALRIAQLAPSHPLRPILGEALGGCHRAHRLGLAPSGALSVVSLKGPSVDAAVGAAALSWDEVEPFGPDSFPGSRVVDLFQPRIHTHAPPSRKDDEVAKYKTSLDVAWAAACGDESCCVVAADVSVPSGGIFQAAAAALVFRWGRQEACVVSAARRHMPPEVERFALQLGISAALAKGCQKLVIFSDLLPAVKSLFDIEVRSGQIFSLDACRAVGPWLAGNPDHSVHLWFIPSRLEWGVQKQAHDTAVALKIAVGRCPRTSHDFMLQHFDVEATKAWHEKFKDPSYRSHSFLDLKGSKGHPLQPSTRKGGPWMSKSAFGTAAFSRLCRCITGHAPLGEYRLCFKLHGVVRCLCQRGLYGPLETRGHALYACRLRTRPNPVTALDTIPSLSKFIEVNPFFCTFAPSTVAWDPG